MRIIWSVTNNISVRRTLFRVRWNSNFHHLSMSFIAPFQYLLLFSIVHCLEHLLASNQFLKVAWCAVLKLCRTHLTFVGNNSIELYTLYNKQYICYSCGVFLLKCFFSEFFSLRPPHLVRINCNIVTWPSGEFHWKVRKGLDSCRCLGRTGISNIIFTGKLAVSRTSCPGNVN